MSYRSEGVLRGPQKPFNMTWLLARCEWDGECLIWQRSMNDRGYGVAAHTTYRGEQLVTRMVVRHFHLGGARFPEGGEASHLCGRPSCVRPEHLVCEDHRRNQWRSKMVGRYAARTHCDKGHPYTVENTYTMKGAGRRCKECVRVGARAAHRAKVEAEGRTYKPRPGGQRVSPGPLTADSNLVIRGEIKRATEVRGDLERGPDALAS